jgi:glycosyltransferase involved in cell wall biosynthesis
MHRAVFRLRIRLAGSWAPYRRLTRSLRWWPIGLPGLRRSARLADPKVAYLLWRYPVLVETMIQREIEGLHRAGLRITVLAQEPEPGVSPLSDIAARDVFYLGPPNYRRLRRILLRFLLRRPLRTTNLFVFVVSRRHGPRKTLAEDRRVFMRAVDVAARVSDLAIDHLHAPWAGHEAFVALVASRLAGVTYSVHARAYDLHRASAVYALPEKLRHAHFAVTNSRFNQAHVRRLLGDGCPPVHRIYNGVDPDRLRPDPDRARNGVALQILSVGRLVPQKGF